MVVFLPHQILPEEYTKIGGPSFAEATEGEVWVVVSGELLVL